MKKGVQYNWRKQQFIIVGFCLLLLIGSTVQAQWQPGLTPANFNFNRVCGTFGCGTSQLNNIATTASFEYDLTPWTGTAATTTIGQDNTMWYNSSLSFQDNFSLCFDFKVVNRTATFQPRKTDGFAFIIQGVDNTGPTAAQLAWIGRGGGELCIPGAAPVSYPLAVEFDMFSNRRNTGTNDVYSACGRPDGLNGACDVEDSPLAEHFSINPVNTNDEFAEVGLPQNRTTPVGLKAGMTTDPYTAPTVRDAANHRVNITWTPTPGSTTVTGSEYMGNAICSVGSWPGTFPTTGTWTDACGNVYDLTNATVRNDLNTTCATTRNCSRTVATSGPGGVIAVTVDGISISNTIADIRNIVYYNNPTAAGTSNLDFIFGFASTSKMAQPDQILIKFCAPLPVDMVGLVATRKEGMVNINWTTITEENNSHFIIERSLNGVDFVAIGKVAGAGNSSTANHYSFIDENPSRNITYYRIVQYDFDHTKSNSKVVNVEAVESSLQISVFPNPFDKNTNIMISSDNANDITLQVYDVNGRMVFEKQQMAVNKLVSFGEELASGIYFVIAVAQYEQKSFKIIKE
jgi:hypothetical protein